MSKIFRFFFFLHFFHIFLSLRPDIDNTERVTAYQTTCIGIVDSSPIVYCADNTWAYGFRLAYYRSSSDDSGVLNIILDCRGQIYDAINKVWSATTSQTAQYINVGDFSGIALMYSSSVHCAGDNGRDFIRGYSLRIFCPAQIPQKGICGIIMTCCYGATIETNFVTTYQTAVWTERSYCKPGWVACGYTMKHQSTVGAIFRATDIEFECCRICDTAMGYYLTAAKHCEHCDLNCAECFETATKCTKCPSKYTLNDLKTCTTRMIFTEVTQEFFNDQNLNVNSRFSDICKIFLLSKGSIIKSITGLTAHFCLKIQMHLYMIGSWMNGNFQILIDGNLIQTHMFTDISDSIYYVENCEGNLLKITHKVDFDYVHTAESVTIQIVVDFIGIVGAVGYWGMNRFRVLSFNCDSSCLTCSGSNADQCTSCNTNTFLQSSRGPSTCATTCPLGMTSDSSLNVCVACHISCKTCSSIDSSSCLSCNIGEYLQASEGPSFCLNTCPNGRYPDISENICKQCDSTCYNCIGPETFECASCQLNLYLQSATAPSSCLSTCPSNNYKDDLSLTCLPCHSACLTCSGPSNSECITCPIGELIKGAIPSNCVSVCNDGLFYNKLNKTCDVCDSSCITCSGFGSTYCESCNSTSFLQATKAPSLCDISCQSGFYSLIANRTCQKCDVSCLNCSSGTIKGCKSCPNGLFLLSPPGPSSCNISCLEGYYPDNATNLCKACNSSCKACNSGEVFGCTKCKGDDYLQGLNGLKSNTTGKCTVSPIYIPILKNTTSTLTYLLIFPTNYSSIYKQYQNKTTIAIDGLNNALFQYNIIFLANTDNFEITFKVNFSITNNPLMHLNLNPPNEIISNYDMKLSTYTLQTYMKYHYYIDPQTQEKINDTAKASAKIDSAASNSFIALNLLSFGSSAVFNSLISIDTIRFLRFFEVKYPENVLSVFRADLPGTGIIPDIVIHEPNERDFPAIFQIYKVSSYVFNNNGNMVIETFVYWIFGISALQLVNHFHSTKNKLIKEAMDLIRMIFIWSFALTYFLSHYMSFTFFTFLFYRFPPVNTIQGPWNILFSICVGIFSLSVFPFAYIKIKGIRHKIFPIVINPFEDNKLVLESPKQRSSFDDSKAPSIKKLAESEKSHYKMEDNILMDNLDTPKLSRFLQRDIKKNSINFNLSQKNAKSNELQTFDVNCYDTLHKDYNQKNIFQSYFILWVLFKQMLYSIIITASFNNPFRGLSGASAVFGVYILSIFIIKPFKEKIEFVHNVFNELCGFSAINLALYMAWMDENGIIDEELKMALGWGIVILRFMIIGAFLLRMFIKLCMICYEFMRDLMSKLFRNKVVNLKNTKI